MIQHIVMLRLKPNYEGAEFAAVMAGLARLDIAGFDGFQHGPNHDVENKTPDHPYEFICRFDNLDALNLSQVIRPIKRWARVCAHYALAEVTASW